MINNNKPSAADDAKEIKRTIGINEIFDRFGISHPNKTDYLINCPWREDRNPSLHIFIGKDKTCKWYDNGTGEHGSVIDVYMRLSGQMDFKEAVREIKNGFSYSSKPIIAMPKDASLDRKKIIIDQVYPYVWSKPLHDHLRIFRGFPIALYNDYINQVDFKFNKGGQEDNNGKSLWGFAIPINNGKCFTGEEWNIRTCFKNGNNKWNIGSGFTLIRNGFAKLVIFEGMCDMLAFVALFPDKQADFLVLNGTGNKEKAIEYLKNLKWPYISIGLILDNDRNKSGQKATKEMLEKLPDYPYRFAEMARRWLQDNPDAPEEERKCYEDCSKCGNVDLTPWIWQHFSRVKGCKDLCEVWQRVSYRDRWRSLRFKSCEVCRTPNDKDTEKECKGMARRGLRHIVAQCCKSYRLML